MRNELGLRERKRLALRDQLIASATRLFIEKGYSATTLEEISQENMVSIRTLLRHFDSKEGLAIASVRARVDQFRLQIEDPDRTLDAASIWRHVVSENIGTYINNPNILDYHVFLTSEPDLVGILAATHDEYSDAIARGLSADAGRDPAGDLDSKVLATLLVQSYRVVLQFWIDQGRTGNLRDLALGVTESLLSRYPDRTKAGYIRSRIPAA